WADEAGPAGPALELVVRREEGLTAAGAQELARALLPVQRAGEGALGTVLAQDGVGRGGEPVLPLGVGMLDLEVLGAHGDGLHAPCTHEAAPWFRSDGFRSVPAHPRQPPSRESGATTPRRVRMPVIRGALRLAAGAVLGALMIACGSKLNGTYTNPSGIAMLEL